MKTLPKLTVCVNIRYIRSRQWGYNPDVTVYAVLDGIRVDESHGSASGCGYDKTSAAVCRAFLDNPLLETLALWDGFDPAKPEFDVDGLARFLWEHDVTDIDQVEETMWSDLLRAYSLDVAA